jgi:Domain of unknown function (DUF4357)
MAVGEEQKLGRSIRLFLVDGVATGLMIAEIVNWSGKAIVVPRSALGAFLARQEARSTGVYMLAGPDADDPTRTIVYVGEAEEVGGRLRFHDKDEAKDFFERAVVFVSKDENLTKAHARFLEAKVVQRVRASGRAKDRNGNEPGGSSLPEADRSDMEYFLTQMELVLPVLGLDVMRPIISTVRSPATAPSEQVFVYAGDGYSAEAVERDGEFIVAKGALVRDKETPTIPAGISQQRKARRADGALVRDGDGANWRLATDLTFSSPSAAAAFVYGGSANGRISWKLKGAKMTYGELREAQLATISTEDQGP